MRKKCCPGRDLFLGAETDELKILLENARRERSKRLERRQAFTRKSFCARTLSYGQDNLRDPLQMPGSRLSGYLPLEYRVNPNWRRFGVVFKLWVAFGRLFPPHFPQPRYSVSIHHRLSLFIVASTKYRLTTNSSDVKKQPSSNMCHTLPQIKITPSRTKR